jgi:DNA-directed RNA polymerase subunit RPC12/RpoP
MTQADRYRCPACNFRIYNRRSAHCEKCGEPIPDELLFAARDIELLGREDAAISKARCDLEREAAEREAAKRRRRLLDG